MEDATEREGTGRGAAALPCCVFLGTRVAQTASSLSLSLTEGPEAPVLTADSNEPKNMFPISGSRVSRLASPVSTLPL